MILNFKSNLFNIGMFLDFMFEGVELVNRVIEIVEVEVELVLKEMDSWYYLIFLFVLGFLCL